MDGQHNVTHGQHHVSNVSGQPYASNVPGQPYASNGPGQPYASNMPGKSFVSGQPYPPSNIPRQNHNSWQQSGSQYSQFVSYPHPAHEQPYPAHEQPCPPHGQPYPPHEQPYPPHGYTLQSHWQPPQTHGQPSPSHSNAPQSYEQPPHGQAASFGQQTGLPNLHAPYYASHFQGDNPARSNIHKPERVPQPNSPHPFEITQQQHCRGSSDQLITELNSSQGVTYMSNQLSDHYRPSDTQSAKQQLGVQQEGHRNILEQQRQQPLQQPTQHQHTPIYEQSSQQQQQTSFQGQQPQQQTLIQGQQPHHTSIQGQQPHQTTIQGQHPHQTSIQWQQPHQTSFHGQQPQQTSFQGQPPQQTSFQGQQRQQTSIQGQPSQQTSFQGQQPQQTSFHRQQPQQTSFQGQPPQQTSFQGQQPQQTSIQGQQQQQTSFQGQPRQQTSIQGQQPHQTSFQGQQPHQTSIQGQQPHQTSIQGQQPHQTSIQGQPPQQQILKTSNLEVHGNVKEGKGSSAVDDLTDVLGGLSLSETGGQTDDGKTDDEMKSYEKDCLLVSGLNPGIPEEDLINYLESIVNEDISGVRYSQDHSMAIVTLNCEQGLEFEHVWQRFNKRKKKLYGVVPMLSPLEVPRKVIVEGLTRETTAHDIQKYFKSSVDESTVVDIEHREEGCFAVVTFDSGPAVKKIVADNNHELNGKLVHVNECYTVNGHNTFFMKLNDEPKVIIVDGLSPGEMRLFLVIDFVDTCKQAYAVNVITDRTSTFSFRGPALFVDKAASELDEKRKAIKRNTVNLSVLKGNLLAHLRVEECIMQKLKDKKVKGGWSYDENKRVATVLAFSDRDLEKTQKILQDDLVERNVDIQMSEDEFDTFEDKLRKEVKGLDQLFEVRHQDDSVLIVATDDVLGELTETVWTICNSMFKKSETRPGRPQAKLTKQIIPRPAVSRYLQVNKHVLRDLEEKFKVSIEYHKNDDKFHVIGPETNAQMACEEMVKVQKELMIQNFEMSKRPAEDIVKERLIATVTGHVERVTRCGVDGVVDNVGGREVGGREIEGVQCAEFQLGWGKWVHVVQGDWRCLDVDALFVAVTQDYTPLDAVSVEIVNNGGKTMKEDFAMTGYGRSQSKWLLHMCFSDGRNILKDNLENSFRKCLEECSKKNLKSVAIPLFQVKHCSGLAEAIVGSVTTWLRETKTNKEVVLLTSSQDGYRKLESLIRQFAVEPAEVEKEEAEIRFDTDKDASERTNAMANEKPDRLHVTVEIIKGLLAEQKTDVIVNSIDPSVDLNKGAIAKSVLEAGGEEIQSHCCAYAPLRFNRGQFFTTISTGRLQCKRVYHCSVPDNTRPHSEFQDLIRQMLEWAWTSGYESIAFPVLGTGLMSYSRDDVANIFFSAVRECKTRFGRKKKVIVVVHHTDDQSFAVFTRHLHSWQKGEKPSQQKSYASVAAGSSLVTSGESDLPHVVTGSIVEQKVDVIVNVVNGNLDLSRGNVSKLVLQSAGSSIQTECFALNLRLPLRPGACVTTSGGRLACRHIFHAVLPGWNEHALEYLYSIMMTTLTEASRRGLASIAYPALGTGKLGYPHSMVANTMFKAVKQYRKDNPYSSLRTILFVVYHKDNKSVNEFRKEYDNQKRMQTANAATENRVPRQKSSIPESPKSKTSETYEIGCVKVKVRQGDVLQESSDCIVLTTFPSKNLYDGTVTKKMLQDAGETKAKMFQDNVNWNEFDRKGLVMTSSHGCCKAKMVLLLNRDNAMNHQREAIDKCLCLADVYDNYCIAFPILTSGSDIRIAERMSEDLVETLQHFTPQQLQQVIIVIFDPRMVTAFQDKLCERLPRRRVPPPRPPLPISEADHSVHANTEETERSPSQVIRFTLAADRKENVNRAVEMLRSLSSQSITETITDCRIDRHIKHEIEDFSAKLGVTGLSIDRQKKTVKVRGPPLSVYRALKQIQKVISTLPSTTESMDGPSGYRGQGAEQGRVYSTSKQAHPKPTGENSIHNVNPKTPSSSKTDEGHRPDNPTISTSSVLQPDSSTQPKSIALKQSQSSKMLDVRPKESYQSTFNASRSSSTHLSKQLPRYHEEQPKHNTGTISKNKTLEHVSHMGQNDPVEHASGKMSEGVKSDVRTRDTPTNTSTSTSSGTSIKSIMMSHINYDSKQNKSLNLKFGNGRSPGGTQGMSVSGDGRFSSQGSQDVNYIPCDRERSHSLKPEGGGHSYESASKRSLSLSQYDEVQRSVDGHERSVTKYGATIPTQLPEKSKNPERSNTDIQYAELNTQAKNNTVDTGSEGNVIDEISNSIERRRGDVKVNMVNIENTEHERETNEASMKIKDNPNGITDEESDPESKPKEVNTGSDGNVTDEMSNSNERRRGDAKECENNIENTEDERETNEAGMKYEESTNKATDGESGTETKHQEATSIDEPITGVSAAAKEATSIIDEPTTGVSAAAKEATSIDESTTGVSAAAKEATSIDEPTTGVSAAAKETTSIDEPTTGVSAAAKEDTSIDEPGSGGSAAASGRVVEWLLIEDTDEGRCLQSYGAMGGSIEEAYQAGEKQVMLTGVDGERFVVDLETMQEYIEGTEEDRVMVIRREKLDGIPDAYVALPDMMTSLGAEEWKLLQVNWSSQEFGEVHDEFSGATKGLDTSVIKIERILNPKLYQSYHLKKKHMETRSGAPAAETRLWHGPLGSPDVVVNISQFGFNRSYCRSIEGDELGSAVWFQSGVQVGSDRPRSGHYHVCLARVLTGQTAVGHQGLRDVPVMSDSLIDRDSNPSKYGVFYDNQALPEYLVTFTVEQ